jgi:hypothetical protein
MTDAFALPTLKEKGPGDEVTSSSELEPCINHIGVGA